MLPTRPSRFLSVALLYFQFAMKTRQGVLITKKKKSKTASYQKIPWSHLRPMLVSDLAETCTAYRPSTNNGRQPTCFRSQPSPTRQLQGEVVFKLFCRIQETFSSSGQFEDAALVTIQRSHVRPAIECTRRRRKKQTTTPPSSRIRNSRRTTTNNKEKNI